MLFEEAGFSIHPSSKAYTNHWIVATRFAGKADLFTLKNGMPEKMVYPVSDMLLVAVKGGN